MVLLLATTMAMTSQGMPQSTDAGGARGVSNALAGRVLNSAGEPIAGAFVALLDARRGPPDVTQLQAVNRQLEVAANDRGEFQFVGLTPGPYYILAYLRELPLLTPAGASRLAEIAYYPASTTASEAVAVNVGPVGRVNADVTMISIPLYTVSGLATAAAGGTFRRGVLRLIPETAPFSLVRGQSIDNDGWFMIRDVQPGRYCLHAEEGVWPPPRDESARVSVARITVTDHDLTQVQVAPIPTLKVTGRVLADSATRTALLVTPVQIGASIDRVACDPGALPAGFVHEDLTFEFEIWPGVRKIVVSQSRPGDVPARVRLNGVDLTETGVEFREGHDISGLEIEIARVAPAPPRVSGVNGAPTTPTIIQGPVTPAVR